MNVFTRGILDRKEQYIYDLNFRNDIKKTLDEQESKSKSQVNTLVDNLLAAYDRAALKQKKNLTQDLVSLPWYAEVSRLYSAKEAP